MFRERIEPHFDEIIRAIRENKQAPIVTGLSLSARAYLLARTVRTLRKSLLVVASTREQADRLASDIRFFLTSSPGHSTVGRGILSFPAYEVYPFHDISPPVEVSARRIEALYSLLAGDAPAVVVATPAGIMQRTLPREVLNRHVEYLVSGEEVDRDALITRLVEGGYYRSQLVEQRGDFSVRGGILDIYPPLAENPIRIEFFGDFIDSIRFFNVLNQRSFESIDEWIVLPVSEIVLQAEHLQRAAKRLTPHVSPEKAIHFRELMSNGVLFPGAEAVLPIFYDETENLLDYLPDGCPVFLLEPEKVRDEGRHIFEEFTEACGDLEDLFPLVRWEELAPRIQERPHALLSDLVFGHADENAPVIRPRHEENLDIRAIAKTGSQHWEQRRELVARVEEWLEMGMDTVWVCSSSRRAAQLHEFFANSEIPVQREKPPFQSTASPGTVRIYEGSLSSGFKLWSEHLIIITDEEFLGTRQTAKPRSKSKIEAYVSSFEDLNPGDLVVHTDHGIGRYRGLVQMDVGPSLGEFLFIEYEGNDRLYIPIYRLKAIQKYAGVDGRDPKLDRLGGKSWARIKKRVKQSVEKIAAELVQVYAARSVRKGHRFSKESLELADFEETFEFEETPDQAKAIREVFADMEGEGPMDRLVCGDVGYGKTEVALRASYKAILDGKQVCYLVPTTVLAEQHLKSFKERFAPYPVRVESLSRFKSSGEQRKVIEGLARGTVDIVIGTHRLLQKDVLFRDLGLLIIDEEHRFGVSHKEKIKQLKKLVDVLTLTATPIPRTLQMSLMGIRDLTTIETPPKERLSIKTYLAKYDDEVVKDAISRELRRGGQIFFVHNQVKTIENMADHIRSLTPQARVGVGHGQLKEAELEKAMMAFINREIDVLVCSTIIESGLDIPAANTIIINRADRFGLAQIYQLRGRTGRSKEQAYAYLLVPSETAMSKEAQKRLKVLMDFTELGSGFKIAFHDLQIRGGGEILGASQSGHIAAVGYEMYLELMEKAVSELKGSSTPDDIDPEINIPFPSFFPESYVEAVSERLSLYKRLSSIVSSEELEDLCAELKDRFGPIPAEAQNLVRTIEARNLMKKGRIRRLDFSGGELAYSFDPEDGVNVDKLMEFARRHPKRTRILPEGRVFYKVFGERESVFEEIRKTLQEMT